MAEARDELVRCAGTQFDKDVVDALLEIAVEECARIQEAVASHASLPDTPLPSLHGVPF
jgi:HD-GYP domain-containing protein (c-di-GMP phosphodiesterase class II)